MHKGDGFSAKAVKKSLFYCQNAAPAMVWPASSAFWKVPLVSKGGDDLLEMVQFQNCDLDNLLMFVNSLKVKK